MSINWKPKKYLLTLPLILYFVFIYRTQFDNQFTLVDDAMISMRYAENLINGNGLVFNQGEYIQGYTNLGWVLWMATLHLFVSNPSLLIMLSSAIALTCLVYIVYKITELLNGNILAVILTACYYPLIFWSLRGMETGLMALLIYLMLYLILKNDSSWKIGLIASLLILIRLDTFPILMVLFLYYRKGYIYPVITLAGVLMFQYLYYDSILPNTYYLKTQGAGILERVVRNWEVIDFKELLIIPFALITVRNKKLFLIFALFLIQFIYSFYVGGDYTDLITDRFIVLGMPAIFILLSLYGKEDIA